MKFSDIYSKNDKFNFSCEVFPPKIDFDKKKYSIKEELNKLSIYNPKLISVTCGAGGSGNHNNSLELVKFLLNFQKSTAIMPHYTCINTTEESTNEYLKILNNIKIKNILALRGDIPEECPHENFDFLHANSLVKYIKTNSKLHIAVAGYPEKHPEAKDFSSDILNLKCKITSGAEAVFTQMFFDNYKFLRFFETVKSFSSETVVIAGVMPITSYSQITKMCKLCGTTIPNNLIDKIEQYKNSPEDIVKIGTEYAIKQVTELQDKNINNFHFYTLNKSEPLLTILKNVCR